MVQMNVVNFDDFSKNNQHCGLAFINLLEQQTKIFLTIPITPKSL
jgi:hypothetical protein